MSFLIAGFGSATPELEISNHDLSRMVDTSDEWIAPRTGIKTRRLCSGESLSELATAAAEQAMKNAGMTPEELDWIICSTVQGDYLTPSLACMVQRSLGATCPAFDLNAACSGCIYLLNIAAALFDSGKAQNMVVICAEMMSRYVDWDDRATCVLFGDGAGAMALRKGDGLRAITVSASGDDKLLTIPASRRGSPFGVEEVGPGCLRMQGSEIFKFAVNKMSADCRQVMAESGVTPGDIKWFVPHQANARIISASQKNLGFSNEQTAVNIDHHGNTSSASIPILLSELANNGEIVSGDYILLSAMGGGLTSGACVIKI